METILIKKELSQGAEMIREGKLVAVPTETVYGLAGNGMDAEAVHRIYEVKGRPEVKPLSLMVPGPEAIHKYCEDVPKAAEQLAKTFWPGPLTIVLKAQNNVPEIVRAGGKTVGLRCPDHPMTLEVLRLAQVPFAAPSANPSGEASPKDAETVLHYFNGEIDAVIDGGPCGIGTESTILDMSKTPYRILRQGALPEADIRKTLAASLVCIGITGGTGCGKTTALDELGKMGALIIDCDAVYHELLESNQALLQEIDSAFPGVVVNGKLERKALGEVVFTNPAALTELNRITHYHIGLAVQQLLEDWAMQGGELAAVDAIELISSGLARRCKATIGVLADEKVRAARIMARDGIGREYALKRIRAQRPNRYFIDNCDRVIENNGDVDSFRKAFDELMEEILKHE